jgi:hypothetical protein
MLESGEELALILLVPLVRTLPVLEEPLQARVWKPGRAFS